MRTKLTLSVDRTLLMKARKKLQRRKRSISAEVNALLERIALEKEPASTGWIDQFGDLEVPLDLKEAESQSWTGKHLRKTAAFRTSRSRKG